MGSHSGTLMYSVIESHSGTLIGASVSEPPLVDSTGALSRYIDIYIYIYIRPAPATAHARRYAQT